MGVIPPFLFFFAGALLMGMSRKEARAPIMLLTPLISFITLLMMGDGASFQASVVGFDLTLFQTGKTSYLFLVLFHIAAFIGGLFSIHKDEPGQHAACLLYAGSAVGAVGAGDLISLCLLYTSPSPRDQRGSRMPSSA